MNGIRKRGGRIAALAGLLLVPVLMARPAAAAGLYTGAVFSFDGLNISVTGCTLTGVALAGLPAGSCGTTDTNAYLTLSGTAGTNAILNVTRTGGGDIFSAATGSNLTYDIVYTLAVTMPGTKTTVNSAALTLAGSARTTAGGTADPLAADYTRVTATETFLAPIPTGATNLATNLNTASLATNFTTPVKSFNVTNDLQLQTGTGNLGNTLKLSSVTLTYGPAPEPVSIGIFLVGLAGLGAARRARSKARAGKAPLTV